SVPIRCCRRKLSSLRWLSGCCCCWAELDSATPPERSASFSNWPDIANIGHHCRSTEVNYRIDLVALRQHVTWVTLRKGDERFFRSREGRSSGFKSIACAVVARTRPHELGSVFPVSAHGTDSGLSFKECFGLVV